MGNNSTNKKQKWTPERVKAIQRKVASENDGVTPKGSLAAIAQRGLALQELENSNK